MITTQIAALNSTLDGKALPATEEPITSGACQSHALVGFHALSVLSVSIGDVQVKSLPISLESLQMEEAQITPSAYAPTNSDWFASEPFLILAGDASATVKQLPFPVDCVVTSPPYFRQRKYGDSAMELGKEDTVEAYVARLVNLFVSVPLQSWGSIWVNIGDKRGEKGELLNIPKRFALAMIDAGFLLVDEVIWAKEVDARSGTPNGTWHD